MRFSQMACVWTAAAASAIGAALLPRVACAQEPATAALEEIVVTAQKREERLQDVPISITALGSAQLENRGIKSLADLGSIAPNVTFRNISGGMISNVAIRGSATSQPAIWMDPFVGLYLNGVYLGKAQGSVFDVADIERVEVLRGPQGTLFGRNTEGGAINFITRKPSGELRGKAGVEFGNLGHKVAKLSLDLPRFGIASVTLAARKQERDAWTENLTGADLGAIDSEAYRLSLKLDFTDRFSALYDFDYSHADNTPPVTSLYATSGWRGNFPAVFGAFLGGAIGNALAPFASGRRPDAMSTSAVPIYERSKNSAHALTLSWQASDDDEIKYIFSRRTMDYGDAQDLDGTPLVSITPAPGFSWGLEAYSYRATEYEQDTHELQWIGSRGRLNYTLGLYHFEDDGITRGAQNFSLFGNPLQRAEYATGTRAAAAFGQVDYHLTDRWIATAGVRYTEEEKSGWSLRYRTAGFDGPRTTDILPFTSYSADFSGTTPMAAIAFKPNDDLNFYARVAKGFKSGGFSSEISDPRVATAYGPQSSVSTEVGVKSMLWGGRARLNAALFHADISDQQTTQLLPGTTQSLVVNAGESTYRGVELEAMVLLADGWQSQLSYGYLDAKFDTFIDNALNLGPSRPLIDTAGNRLASDAPKHTANVNLDGRLARGGWGELRAVLDYSYTAKLHQNTPNKDLTAPNAGGAYVVGMSTLPARRNLNARLLLADVPAGLGTMDFSLWGRNLTDEADPIHGIDFSMYRTKYWQEPRTYMFTATYKW